MNRSFVVVVGWLVGGGGELEKYRRTEGNEDAKIDKSSEDSQPNNQSKPQHQNRRKVTKDGSRDDGRGK